MIEILKEALNEEIALNSQKITDIVLLVIGKEGFQAGDCTIVFGSDNWLLHYNKQFLKHDYYTDIITFDYSEGDVISGDLLVSLERVYDNASKENVSRETELSRVLIHGVLHLCGYKDKLISDITIMRKKEGYYLSLL